MYNVIYVIIKDKLIQNLDFEKTRGRYKVYISQKETIRYNKNKFFFQTKKGIIKLRYPLPKELEGYKSYKLSEIQKITGSNWGQWKLN